MSELSIAWGHWKAFVHAKFWLSRVRYSGSCAYSAQGVLLHQDILEVKLIFINELAPDVFGARSFLVDAFGMTAWNYLTYHADVADSQAFKRFRGVACAFGTENAKTKRLQPTTTID
jgi:hypothetical protein